MADLSKREREILSLLADGRCDKEIAAALGLKPSTVQSYIQRLKRELDCDNRVQLGIAAARAGLLD